MGEFDLIERIRARAPLDDSVVVGIGDDAAVLAPTPGAELVVTTDSLVLDRHFTTDRAPADIGHLAAHANLSDLAAMGATPRWALLALTLADDDPAWLEGFLDGFLAAAADAGMVLVGGNLARGPCNVGVQLIGEVAGGRALTRRGARVGDRIVVTGTLGDAAAALARPGSVPAALRRRLHRPSARLRAGRELAAIARSAIDLSDGLLADLAHLLESGQGAAIDLDALPTSAALLEAVPDPAERWRLQAGGGSDYELLAAVPPHADLTDWPQHAGVALTGIGRVTDGGGIECRSGSHRVPEDLAGRGWDHFEHG